MKILRTKEQGGVLVSALIVLGLIGLTLIATMDMVSSQRKIIARAQTWNSAIPICEAGIEDALAHINYSGTTNLASDGWTYTGTNYWRSNNLSGGYYMVSIGSATPPVIVSQGFVLAPISTNYISRTVQVNTRQNGLFPDALLAKNTITMSGGAKIDSFNSSNSTYSTFGKYDATKAEANANVDSMSSAAGAIAVGTGKIYGKVDTAPGGTVTVSGEVGTNATWVNNAANAGQIETDCSASDLNTIIPDVVLPNLGSTLTPTSATVGGTNYTYSLANGNYTLAGSPNIGGGNAILVSGNCILYVTGSLTVSGSGYIYIAPGGSLQLYVAGPKCDITGGGVVNGAQTASQCQVWGLPTCTELTCSGSAGYIGTIYAPEAVCTISGSAASSGAFVGNSFTISGSGAIHYDEALGGPVGYKYLVSSWQEN